MYKTKYGTTHLNMLWEYQKTLSHTSKRGSGEGWEARTCNAFKRTFHCCESSIKDNVTNTTLCRRDALFQFMENYIHEHIGSNCLCCDVCALSCKCGRRSEKNCFFHSFRLSEWIVSTCFDCELNILSTSNLATHTSYTYPGNLNQLRIHWTSSSSDFSQFGIVPAFSAFLTMP